ncbi:MAG: hypothetical protein H0T76_11745 [Nannocystis sp.]|nr:hypothetical protein [Nannocystis sp.]MBA3547149.1 hypothetical protein [Nannocystis sp.]
MRTRWLVMVALGVGACSRNGAESTADASTGATTGATTAATTTPTTGAPDPDRATMVHSFGVRTMQPFAESEPCVQWTLDNDQPIYVNTVTMVNDGGFHHSNWLAVPEDKFPGADGFFDCGERGFTELDAAVSGTVLFAQSTQSRSEAQVLPPGVVVKIPPRHKIVAGVHLLNLGSTDLDSELRMALELVHPRTVEVVVAPFRFSYFDLNIPANQRSGFTSSCSFDADYANAVGGVLDIKLYYVLPHFHYLGDAFSVDVIGGPEDGRNLYTLNGFDADANGRAFDPPVELAGATGLRFYCGFDNWRDKAIGWGIGDQEMCVMLGLADSRAIMDLSVQSGSQVVGVDGDVTLNEGPCTVFALPKNEAQTLPTDEERTGEFYVPPSSEGDVDLEPTKSCVDSDRKAAPSGTTLSHLRDAVLVPGCIFSSCHDAKQPTAGLDLQSPGLHAALLDHPVVAGVDIPLVKPGDPDNSWLYQLVSQCEPQDAKGSVVRPMPYNAPTLLPDAHVAALRAWIAAGAADD